MIKRPRPFFNPLFNKGNYYIDDKKFEELKDFEIQPFDILITAAGTIGRIAIVPENIKRGIINQALIRLRLNNKVKLKRNIRLRKVWILLIIRNLGNWNLFRI